MQVKLAKLSNHIKFGVIFFFSLHYFLHISILLQQIGIRALDYENVSFFKDFLICFVEHYLIFQIEKELFLIFFLPKNTFL